MNYYHQYSLENFRAKLLGPKGFVKISSTKFHTDKISFKKKFSIRTYRRVIYKSSCKQIMNNSTKENELSCNILGTTHYLLEKSLSKELLINYIFAFVLNSILIIPTILLNVIAILTISKSSSLKEKPCYFTILFQSVIDLGVGIITIPLFLVYGASAMGEYSNCIVVILAGKIGFLMIDISTVALSTKTLERYIAILHPFGYKVLVTKRRILICTLAGSLVQLSGTVLSLNYKFAFYQWLLAQSTFFFLFIASAYTRIFLVVKNTAAKLQKNLPGSAKAEEDSTRKKLFLQDIKQAKSCFIVVLCYVALYYLPLLLEISFEFAHEDKKFLQYFKVWCKTLSVMNSSVNSAIFFWTKVILRREAAKMLKAFRL